MKRSRDSERLAYLIRTGYSVTGHDGKWWVSGIDPWTGSHDPMPAKNKNGTDKYFKTARQAIDAAMRAERGGRK